GGGGRDRLRLAGIFDPIGLRIPALPGGEGGVGLGPAPELFHAPGSTTGEWWNFAGEWRLLLMPLSVLALAMAFVFRYGRALGLTVDWRRFRRPIRGWIPSRLSSPLAALSWKQFRETLPWSLRVLGASTLLGAVVA